MNQAPAPPMLAVVAVATTILIWATAFPAIKLALVHVAPLELAAFRYALAAVFAAAWLLWMRPTPMPAIDLLGCAFCGIVGAAGYSVLINFGQQTISAGAASFLVKTESIWMAALGVLILKERFSLLAWAGTAVCFIGVGVIASAQPGGIALGAGAPYILFGAFFSALGFIVQRRLAQRHGALYVAAIMFLAGALALSFWLPSAITQFAAAPTDIRAWVIFLGLGPTLIGFAAWSYALSHFDAARAGNFLYLIAPLAVLLAWLLSGETPAVATLAGGALILGGVMLVSAPRSRRAPAAAEGKPVAAE